MTTPSGIAGYDLTSLGVGSYLNWSRSSSPVTPGGVEFIQVIKLRNPQGTFVLDPAVVAAYKADLAAIAAAQPGSAWLVGNEPDTTYENQDSLTPDQYAQAYYETYAALKAADPTARIGIGTIVQPTPVRLLWLDRMWSAYQTRYGTPPPSDFWSIHSFILNEAPGEWGTGLPPGLEDQSALAFVIPNGAWDQTYNINTFKQRLVNFRSWMAGKGERNKPLWITEYGSLFPSDPSHGFVTVPITVTRDYMLATFNYMLTAADASTGYPLDGNRLVQRWYWYSLNDYLWKMGGALFDPDSGGARTIIGDAFVSYVNAITPTVNVGFYNLALNPRFPATSWPTAYSLTGQLLNTGNTAVPAGARIVVSEVATDTTATEVASLTLSQPLPGCSETRTFTLTWTETTTADALRLSIELPAGAIADGDLQDNMRTMYANPFADVPFEQPQFRHIEALYRGGYTAGCSTNPLQYCPATILDRAQGAVFVMRGQFGTSYIPPAPTSFFTDNWSLGPYAEKWAEALFNNGFSSGCTVTPRMYCPWFQHTRAEASVFYLRILHGASYVPPAASGTLLGDVTDPLIWYAKWSEQAYLDGLLPACGTVSGKPAFCPNDYLSRAWAAYMMVKAKNLTLP